ncbi:MAG: hypothetical protein EA427_07270 [Spirochaetaceae bacterium]|nr:MAG: hypothetical protein EA427_07270 [Spirochaetaceae bacterium]
MLKTRVPLVFALLFLLSFGGTLAWATPDPAGDVAWSLWHPSSLGAPLTGQYRLTDPLAALSFPHLHALAREPRLAFAGGGVPGEGTAGGAAGLIVPGRQVIWNGALSLLGDDTGFHGRGVLALARPLGARLQGGAGASFTVAEADDDVTVGAGVDVGFRFDMGVFRELSRVDLHVAFLNMGAAPRRGDYDPLVPGFTPVAGVRARVMNTETASLDISGSLRAHGFSRPAFEVGAALAFVRGPAVHIGWRYTSGQDEGALWPGLSLGMRFTPGPTAFTTVQPGQKGAVLLAGEVTTGFETTDQEPPALTASMRSPRSTVPDRLPREIFLSPSGFNSQIELDLGAVDNRGIQEIETRLTDEQGRVVRTWRHAPMGSLVPTGTLTERLVSELWQRKITGTIYWDVYDSVPDGRYRMEISALDLAGNRTALPAMDIVVDGTPPFMEATVVPVDAEGTPVGDTWQVNAGDPPIEEELVVAPEEDVRFTLLYRDAERLSLHVVDQAGRDVVPLSAQPEGNGTDQRITLSWPGTERDGTRISEGVYRIRAEAMDALGNRSTLYSPPLLIQSIRPRFTVAVSDTIVAPTGDGNRDTITLTPSLEPLTGLQEWSLELLDREGRPVTRWSGIDLPPQAIVLDRATFPSDGEYTIVAVSRYRNGLVAGDRTVPILVDTTPPSIDLIPGRTRIQPDIDPVLPLFIEPDEEAVRTRLVAVDRSGRERLVREWVSAPERYDWQLFLADGTFMAAGEQDLFLEAWDEAGNRARSRTHRVTLLERLEGVGIVPERHVFGPTGNGRFDTIRLLTDGSPFTRGAGNFEVSLAPAGSTEPVRRFAGELPLPAAITWDGRDDEGRPAPDGDYRATLTVTVPDRGSVSNVSTPFRIDTRPPEVSLAATPEIVSPDGDGRQDELIIRPVLGDEGRARYILYRGDEEIRARLPRPEAGPTEWEPRLADGTVLPDGDYAIVLEMEDDAGNRGRTEPISFTVDTRPVSGFVRISTPAFSPGSPETGHVTFTPVLPVTRGIDRWEFLLKPYGGGDPLLIWEGGRDTLPQPVRWEGEDLEAGGSVPDGEYTALLRARYRHGPVVDVRSPPVRVDATPPEVILSVAPQPFSPDGDGVDDTVTFTISVEDASPIRYWILEIYDPAGEFFYDLGGRGEPPGRIVWDGRARTGELVVSAEEYPWRLEIADGLGNVTVKEGVLETDVLVERYGEGYRIQLPSITFPPNSSVLDLDPAGEAGARNRQVIERLVEILGRFPDYQIVIEGHAVNLSGTEREQREELVPLSRDRAAAVRRALVDRGVSARLLSVEGRGGSAPIVPHTDEINRWKNRRVDFLLKR